MSEIEKTILCGELKSIDQRIDELKRDLAAAETRKRQINEALRGGVVWVVLERAGGGDREVLAVPSVGQVTSKVFGISFMAQGLGDPYDYEARAMNDARDIAPFNDHPRQIAWGNQVLSLRAYESPEEAAAAISRNFHPDRNARW